MSKRTRKISYLGFFLSIALICSYIESLIPFSIGIPGIKLGLTNIVVVMMMYVVGDKEALLVSILRMILVGFMFGNAFSIVYSLSGGLLSFLIMFLLKKTNRLHYITVSIYGGVFHNIGQIIMASLIVENYKVTYYIPVLIVAGVITGTIIGIVSSEVIYRMQKMKFELS